MRTTVRKTCGLLTALTLVIVLPLMAGAQNPNFAGTWTLNQAESNLGAGGGGGGGRMMGGPAASMTIAQTGDKITITTQRAGRDGSTREMVEEINADGQAHTTEGARGGPTTTTASWKDGKLVVTSERSFQDRTMTTTTTYSLQNGKLVMESQMPNMREGGTTSIKAVYDKK